MRPWRNRCPQTHERTYGHGSIYKPPATFRVGGYKQSYNVASGCIFLDYVSNIYNPSTKYISDLSLKGRTCKNTNAPHRTLWGDTWEGHIFMRWCLHCYIIQDMVFWSGWSHLLSGGSRKVTLQVFQELMTWRIREPLGYGIQWS